METIFNTVLNGVPGVAELYIYYLFFAKIVDVVGWVVSLCVLFYALTYTFNLLGYYNTDKDKF